jgi:hypothetical protein
MPVSNADLEAHVSLSEPRERVAGLLTGLGSDWQGWARFIGRYTRWNRCFGSAVAGLASRIGSARETFLESGEPLAAVADRSVLVASFFFDAARDEFDDRDTKARDTHRCLAQAFVKGFCQVAQKHHPQFPSGAALATLLDERPWLRVTQARVFAGYGAGFPVEQPFLFRAMGYHLGSELLADQEFTLIDQGLHKAFPKAINELAQLRVRIADEEHGAYQWVRIHSGAGGAVEADHFAWAITGIDRAFRYTPDALHADMRDQVLQGYAEFAHDQRAFFERVTAP